MRVLKMKTCDDLRLCLASALINCNETGIFEQLCTSGKESLRLQIVYVDIRDGYITNS